MYHYVYRITNIIELLHYYGVRTSKNCLPKEDLGIKYFSSSSDKEFKADQKLNPQNYKYKVVRICSTRDEANELEIQLHNKFDVGINEFFYNRAKQTSAGFSGGNIEAIRKQKETVNSQEWKETIGKSKSKACRITKESKEWKETIGKESSRTITEKLKITLNDPKWKDTIGKEAIRKQKETVNSQEWKETIGKKKTLNDKILKNSKEYIDTIGKEAIRKQKETVSSKEWLDTIGKKQYEGIRLLMNSEEWLDTIGKEAIRKQKETVSSKEWLDTIGKEAIRKQKETKGSQEWKETIGIKVSINRQKKGKWYRLFKYNESIILPRKEIRNLSISLFKSSKDKPLGYNKSSKINLNIWNKLHMVGWYIEEINISESVMNSYFKKEENED